ncbi:hypothetical protein C8R44DRAFT_853637 [Mycena epipterygia]|nr:hypothetical protein C8R44DRAFT_853637 [Mycena epipterygia]
MLDTLPPEIFARILEIAIESWGIGFLPPICRVSSTCHNVVVSTPSLWGIMVVGNLTPASVVRLNLQLAKAKSADITITVLRKMRRGNKRMRRFMDDVSSLTRNWVRADMPTDLLSWTQWADMGRVEVLSLRLQHDSRDLPSADKFFESGAASPPRLHSFTASSLPEEWVTRFLNPRIAYFEIGRLLDIRASTIQRYLSLIPNVHTLDLLKISFLPLSASDSTIDLSNLNNLEVTEIRNLTPLLLNIRAPALRVFSVRNCTGQMGSVLSQWSQADFLPSSLQTLELSNCLSETDLPFLIGWLARLPVLLRLTITHTKEIGDPSSPTSSVESDLLKALASPDGAGPVVGGWLCPSLIHLCLDTNLPRGFADILPIARARGGATAKSPGLHSKLRSMQAQLCSSGTADELAEFQGFFTDASDARCLCLGCGFNLSSQIRPSGLRRADKQQKPIIRPDQPDRPDQPEEG